MEASLVDVPANGNVSDIGCSIVAATGFPVRDRLSGNLSDPVRCSAILNLPMRQRGTDWWVVMAPSSRKLKTLAFGIFRRDTSNIM